MEYSYERALCCLVFWFEGSGGTGFLEGIDVGAYSKYDLAILNFEKLLPPSPFVGPSWHFLLSQKDCLGVKVMGKS